MLQQFTGYLQKDTDWSGRIFGCMDCSLCDKAIPTAEVFPLPVIGQEAVVTNFMLHWYGWNRRKHEIHLSTLSSVYFPFRLCYNFKKYKEYNGLLYLEFHIKFY
jgi:hypothetical protein